MLLTSPIWGGRFRPFPVYLLSSLASAQGGSHHIRHWHPAMWDAGGRASELQPLRMIAHMGEDSFWLTIPSLLWLAELMAHKHTWLHKGGETDWWSDSVAPGDVPSISYFHIGAKQSVFKSGFIFLSQHDIQVMWISSCISLDHVDIVGESHEAAGLMKEQNVCSVAVRQFSPLRIQ